MNYISFLILLSPLSNLCVIICLRVCQPQFGSLMYGYLIWQNWSYSMENLKGPPPHHHHSLHINIVILWSHQCIQIKIVRRSAVRHTDKDYETLELPRPTDKNTWLFSDIIVLKLFRHTDSSECESCPNIFQGASIAVVKKMWSFATKRCTTNVY